MFEWNEEEFADIIWGEAGESDDHIVPYPKEDGQKVLVTFGDPIKKQGDQGSNPSKTVEQKTPGPNNASADRRLESGLVFNRNEGFSTPGFDMDSWSDLPLSISECGNGFAVRDGQDSISEISSFNPSRDDTAQLDSDRELFVDEHIDKQDGFLDYGWDNIESFDDLDRLFRDDDSIFGHENLGNVDELWSSTDAISSPAASFPLSRALKSAPEQCEVKMEFVPHEAKSSTPGNGKMNDLDSEGLLNLHPTKDAVSGKQNCSSVESLIECSAEGSKPLLREKTTPEEIGKTEASNSYSVSMKDITEEGSKQRKLQIKSEEGGERKLSQDLHGAWSPTANQCQQEGNQFASSALQTFPSSVLGPQRHISEPDSLRYLQSSHSYFPAGYGNQVLSNMPPFQNHPERDKPHRVLVSHEFSSRSSNQVSTFRKSPDVSTNSLIMTPQEKIEKLRRRQQMQAMLAIQKQQQQFTHQATCTDQSMTQKCQQVSQSDDTVGAIIEAEENLKIPPSAGPTSPVEQDDSNTVSMVVDECSLEERILNQLLEVIGKLDNRTRLCIRDSLYRLAESAMLRHSAADTISTNKTSGNENVAAAQEESNSHNRSTIELDGETQTNPIDRTVAHLLFYQPTESSARPVQDGETPKSTMSTKLPFEQKIGGLVNLPMECLSESSTEKQDVSHPGAKSLCTFSEALHEDQFKGSPYTMTPSNASNNDLEDGVVTGIEASK